MPMKFAFAMLAVASSSALSQGTLPTRVDQVTDAQIAAVQSTVEGGCVRGGLRDGEPESEVRKICACISNFVRTEIPKQEWQQVVIAAAKQDHAAAQAILNRHGKAMQVCKPSVAGAPSQPK